jgi:hypothetical protein
MNQIIADTTFERISQFYFSDETVLAPEDEAIRIRWSTCFMQLNDELNTDRDVSVFMVKQFGISEGQAYKDIRNCRRLFGDVRTYTKEAMRYHVTQWAIELLKMAKLKKDLRGMEKALERITKAYNLDKEDLSLPDPAKFQPPIQLLTINYNFINSPSFQMIDLKAQEKLMELHRRIEAMADELHVKDYLNMLLSENPAAEMVDVDD